ncbi:MAG: DUF4019 domain-containing protein [Verrucomicrobia bacterium]|nr:DUF4019 domain-containing protein [Verrucomicrobiota bacterium]
MKTYRFLFLLFVSLAFAGCGKSGPPTPQEQAATDAALSWLALVDKGSYAESWEETATVFKKAVTRDQWVNTLKAGHNPAGQVESRTVLKREYMTSLPNTPKGEYVVIQFKTHFANKKNAVETVTPMMDSDGRWRVSGYYVK